MSKTSENALEQTTLSWFESLGWQAAFGPDISPDLPAPGAARQAGGLSCKRKDYDQVALLERIQPNGKHCGIRKKALELKLHKTVELVRKRLEAKT